MRFAPAFVMMLAACSVAAEPPARVSGDAQRSLQELDYADWTATLRTHVDDRGLVDYAALAHDRGALDRFVATIGAVGPRTRPDLFRTSDERLAYYLNAYNALTMFNVVNRMPKLKSVHDARLRFFVFTRFTLDGDEINLKDLESKVIRPTFADARVHFALNCASLGCPRLPREPFVPERLSEQLDRETDRFLHEERNVDVVDGKVVLSSIFDWYKEDFGGDPVGWIRRTAPDLGLPDGEKFSTRDYDWRLNARSSELSPR